MKFNHNQHLEYRALDSLIDNNIRFALYRLPGEPLIHLVLQMSPNENQFENLSELNSKEGFVIAPFHISKSNPIVLIKAETVLNGIDTILKHLKENILQKENIQTERTHKEDYTNSDFETYSKTYNRFQAKLEEGKIQKLVLSRTFEKKRNTDFSAGISFMQACEAYPNNFVYLCNTPETGCWLGCSPELLISGQPNSWKTVALAGTKDNNEPDWDEKNRIEQQIVVDYVKQQLAKNGFSYSESDPVTIRSGNIKHIKTELVFKSDNELIPEGKLLELLHPTPAVCGFPKDEAFQYIIQNEGYDRSYYSGFLGCLNLADKTDLYVNLRCMKIYQDVLCLYAGGGILKTSELESEWEETEKKLQTMLSIVNE